MHPSPWPTPRTVEYAAVAAEREPRLRIRHDQLRAAFPLAYRRFSDQLSEAIPPDGLAPGPWLPMRLDSEAIVVPRIVYNDPIPPGDFTSLPETAQAMALTLYTRHHDGYVREDAVSQLVERIERWMSTFILLALGDMVEQVAAPVAALLRSSGPNASALREALVETATLNPAAFRTTRSRAVSYWHCYFRREIQVKELHSGVRACDDIAAAVPRGSLLGW